MPDEDEEDICGLCGEPGADKYACPNHWPGERMPNTLFVHAECEIEERRRAHSVLTTKQRRDVLDSIWRG
jgi:tRNA G37 N-methylase TrmD